jgi:DNA-binding Xre family transcriptional regulator
MVAFVLVKPTFYLKAMNFITIATSGSIFNKSYFTVDNCQQLCERLKISIQDFVRFVPNEFSE